MPLNTQRERVDVHVARGPLPTKAEAIINLRRACIIYADRSSPETFEELANAVAVARVLRLW